MKSVPLTIIIAALIVGGAIFLSKDSGGNPSGSPVVNNVEMVDGTQVITIGARGGYSPRVTTARAGVPTVLNVATQNTFDCSAALVIPSIGYRKTLPPSGKTSITLPPQEFGAVVRGLCAMGMYSFEIQFN